MALVAARDAGAGHGPTPLATSIYAVVKDPRRGKRQGRDEPRAQEYRGAGECRHLAAHSSEARVPKPIIQEGKKGFRSLLSVFMEIQAVTGFCEEILTWRNLRVSRYHCWKRVTVEMRVKAESRPIPPENV